jgi:hypothetical protein
MQKEFKMEFPKLPKAKWNREEIPGLLNQIKK